MHIKKNCTTYKNENITFKLLQQSQNIRNPKWFNDDFGVRQRETVSLKNLMHIFWFHHENVHSETISCKKNP